MRRLVDRLRNERSILRGAMVLGSGAALGQIVLVLVTPIISRLYTPSEIGLFALYLSFVGVAVTIAPLGYTRAIPTARDDDEAAVLASGVIRIQPLTCALLAVGQWWMIRTGHFGFDELPLYTVPLSFFSIFANTLLFTLQFWFIRAESYPIISRVAVMQNVGRAGLQVGLGAASAGLLGLIVGDFGGRLLGLTGMLRRAWGDVRARTRSLSARDHLAVFRRFRKFLFPQLPSIVINTVARLLPVPLLVSMYGTEAAGLYAMVDRVLQVPVAFLSKSVGDALHGRIGNLSRSGPEHIMGAFLKSAGALFLVGLVPAIVLLVAGPPIFGFVLGEQWTEAGTFASLLAPLALMTLVVSTSSRVVYVFQAFYTELWYNVVSIGFVIGVFWTAGHNEWEILQTVSWLARLGVVAYIFYFVLLILIVRRGVKRIESIDHSE